MAVFFYSILWIIFFRGNAIFAKEIYTNIWAVRVRGSQQEAMALAIKYGLSYDEQVSESLNFFKFASELVKHFVDVMKDNDMLLIFFTNIYPELSDFISLFERTG